MNLPSDAHTLLSHLSAALGLRELTFNADGVCALAIADRLSVHILADPNRGEFLLFAVAASLPSDPSADQLRYLLEANRFWHETGGATLSLDDQEPPRVILAQRLAWSPPDAARFVQNFEHFVGYLDEWRDRLAEAWQPLADAPQQARPDAFA